jgi:hypothetical protein
MGVHRDARHLCDLSGYQKAKEPGHIALDWIGLIDIISWSGLHPGA